MVCKVVFWTKILHNSKLKGRAKLSENINAYLHFEINLHFHYHLGKD